MADPTIPWYLLFETMMEAKSAFPYIQDYSLSETSLEEVFLFFARNQKGEDSKFEVDADEQQQLEA